MSKWTYLDLVFFIWQVWSVINYLNISKFVLTIWIINKFNEEYLNFKRIINNKQINNSQI